MKFTSKMIHVIEIIIGIVFICLSIFQSNFWFDEAYSIAIAKHSFAEIWTIGGNDVHPILYYWFLHIIGMFTNYSIIAFRIFSAIPIIILGILGYTHIRKDFGEKQGLIFTLLIFFLPVMAVYTEQIRMYSWAILSVTILAIYAYRIFKENESNKNIIIFGLSSWFSIYVHYYGLMAAGLINLFLLIYLIVKKRKSAAIKITVFGVIQLISYIPWMINFATQLKNVSSGFWIGFEFPKTLIELLSFEFLGDFVREKFGILHYGIFILSLVLYVYVGIKLYKLKKENEDVKPAVISLIIYAAVIIAALLITLIMWTSILYYRYLFVITGLYVFVLSFVLAREKNTYITAIICTIIVILGLVNNTKLIKQGYDTSNDNVVEYMKNNIAEGESIVYSDIGVGAIVDNIMVDNQQYFYNAEKWGIYEAYQAFAPVMKVEEDPNFISECSDRIWLIGYNHNVYNLLFNNGEYNIISERNFDTSYQGNLFKIICIEKVK